MVDELTKCPDCKTRTLARVGKELVCSECGGHFPAPEEGASPPSSSSASSSSSPSKHEYRLERHQFYEKNKKEIIRDYEAKGGPKTAEKWKVPWANLYQLLRRWGIIKTPSGTKRKGTRSPQQSASKHAYYERNKLEIIKDLFTFGRAPTRKKWEISNSTLFSLEKRWLTADQKATLDTWGSIRRSKSTRQTIVVTYYRPGVYGVRPEPDNLNFEYLLPTAAMMHETINMLFSKEVNDELET